MKKPNAVCDYTQSRNRNLRSVFYKCLGSKSGNMKDVYAAMADFPADRFYISEDRAYFLIYKKRKTGRWPAGMQPKKLSMIRTIDRRVKALRSMHPGLSLKEAVFRVVNSPAPRFYLTVGTIKVILSSTRR